MSPRNQSVLDAPLSEHTPLMQQYVGLKQKYPECLVAMKLGDFYEFFFDDARAASKALDLTLSRRGESAGMPVLMTGIPYHALAKSMRTLVEKGHQVAIAEPVSKPGAERVWERVATA